MSQDLRERFLRDERLKSWLAAIPEDCLDKLVPTDAFYKELGGLFGYRAKILELLQKSSAQETDPVIYHSPSFIDISHIDEPTEEAISSGIAALPDMAEMYPLGGAADRLHLIDDATGAELPAAKLPFAGKTLLEHLIRDLQAREYLYYRRYGKQVTTPVAMMTSREKENRRHVEELMVLHRWFGRPKDSFRLFEQPLVPVVNMNGELLCSSSGQLILKPNGHGAIWKLARDEGIFSWFEELHRKKILVRQINNPIAGLDYGLLAFTGIGWKKNMRFGFASCLRLLKAAEGMNVVIERKNSIVLTNVEYCDFAKCGIEDSPIKEGDITSRFSSNTNILFADLQAIKNAVKKCPFPGLILNLKKGEGRLESTMQNIADVFIEKKGESSATKKTFITYNHRHKTISTAKKAFAAGGSFQETPELCFYDLLTAARELLQQCNVDLPEKRSLEEYHRLGPDCVLLYHPALGPLYSIIQQKIQGGRLSMGSALELEISDLILHNLSLDGYLKVQAEQIMGHTDAQGILQYSNRKCCCILRNAQVRNQGADWEASRPVWKGRFVLKEGVEIFLKGRSQFIAEDVIFEGSHRFVVEDGQSMRVLQKEGSIALIVSDYV